MTSEQLTLNANTILSLAYITTTYTVLVNRDKDGTRTGWINEDQVRIVAQPQSTWSPCRNCQCNRLFSLAKTVP